MQRGKSRAKSWARYRLSVMQTLEKLRQEEHEFEARWDYRLRLCLKSMSKQGSGGKEVGEEEEGSNRRGDVKRDYYECLSS